MKTTRKGRFLILYEVYYVHHQCIFYTVISYICIVYDIYHYDIYIYNDIISEFSPLNIIKNIYIKELVY